MANSEIHEIVLDIIDNAAKPSVTKSYIVGKAFTDHNVVERHVLDAIRFLLGTKDISEKDGLYTLE